MKAIILAAGSGQRMQKQNVPLPKPLVQLGGLSLLERATRTALRAGATEVIIVVGAQGDKIRAALESRLAKHPVQWVQNDAWELGNGTSVIAGCTRVPAGESFMVLMCDHLLFWPTLDKLMKAAQAASQTMMAVDFKRGLLADPDDATKVRIQGNQIVEIKKQLDPYNAIDTGAAVCTPDFLNELKEAAQTSGGPCAHTDGMRRLSAKGQLLAYDIGADRWEDVDDLGARKAAASLLFNSLRKPTDGFMSRHIERRLSLTVTKLLCRTPITPNMVTMGVVCLGGVAAFFFSRAGLPTKMVGSLLFWMSSFLDGCDGELARLKFTESRLGGWLDLWSDNVVHCMVFTGIGVGLSRDLQNPMWIALGLAASLGVLLSVLVVTWRTQQSKHKGTLYTSVAGSGPKSNRPPWLEKLIHMADAMSRRDFIFWLMLITVLGGLPWFLWAAAVGSNAYFVVLVLIQIAMARSKP